MADAVVAPLLGPDDPAPFTVHNAQAASPWLLIADHAGQRVPARLANLGLPQFELDRHIGWDIGIAQVTQLLADALDAVAIAQTYSRLVVDCNRPRASATLMPEVSDGTSIPGNLQLSAEARRQRIDEIFAPYHARIAAELETRAQRQQPTLLVSMHSFTPIMAGHARPWHAGVLYNRDTRLAHRLLQALRAEPDLVVGDNQPYAVSDASDYAIPVYGEGRGLPHVELEIRQDLIADAAGQHAWAQRLARILPPLAQALLLP
ncbi:putative N-formylglutamate amidohydrolase [Xanthomonas arboricola]|nr:putative N-formylglutamate amidohydrolase [Xanthomonas cannabis]